MFKRLTQYLKKGIKKIYLRILFSCAVIIGSLIMGISSVFVFVSPFFILHAVTDTIFVIIIGSFFMCVYVTLPLGYTVFKRTYAIEANLYDYINNKMKK